jgi:hypothetical protein
MVALQRHQDHATKQAAQLQAKQNGMQGALTDAARAELEFALEEAEVK